MMRYAKEGVGEAIVNVIGSISELNDKLYQSPTILANYGNIKATLKTTAEVLDTIRQIKNETADIQGRNGDYIRGMMASYEMHAHVLDGEKIPYVDACKVMQQVDIKPIPQSQYDKLSEEIGKDLGKLGYKGDTAAKVNSWLNETKINPDDVVDTIYKCVGKSKESTLKKVITLPEGDEIVEAASIRNVFWSGRSQYLGNFKGDLTFNIDRPWSVPTFTNILCHEGYPGHQTFYCHWDDLFLQGKLPLEAAHYSTTGNPATCMFEGGPEVGLHFLGWDDYDEETPEITDEEKETFRIGRNVLDLQRMLQTQGSYLHNVEGEDEESVVKYMMSTGIFSEIESRNSFAYYSHTLKKYYYPSYYYGKWMIYEAYELVPKSRRDEFFKFLYDIPHTNQTFIDGISQMFNTAFQPFKNR